MESEDRSSFQNFHLKAAADLSTWLYRVTHSDYESSVLTSIGPGIVCLSGTTFHFDQAYTLSYPQPPSLISNASLPFASLFSTASSSSSSSSSTSSTSSSTTTSPALSPSFLSSTSSLVDLPNEISVPTSSVLSKRKHGMREPSFSDTFVEIDPSEAKVMPSLPPLRRSLSSDTSCSNVAASPDADYHIIQLSCSMPSTASLAPSPKLSSKPIPLRRSSSMYHNKGDASNRSFSESFILSSIPPSGPPPAPPFPPFASSASSSSSSFALPNPSLDFSSSSFHAGTEYEVIGPSTSIDSLDSISPIHTPVEDTASIDESHVLVEPASDAAEGVFLMEQHQLYEVVTHVPTMPAFPLPLPTTSVSLSSSSSSPSRIKNLLSPFPSLVSSFIDTWMSHFWFTYRTGIDLPGTQTDTGWGCMHRTGQMLLSKAFLIDTFGLHFKFSDFTSSSSTSSSFKKDPSYQRFQQIEYQRILSYFLDTPHAPFSINNICKLGQELFELRPGAWYSPSALAWILCKLNQQCFDSPFRILVSNNTLVSKHWLASPFEKTILFISVRLGTRSVHESYAKNLMDLFTWPQFLGIAGGKKHASLYFAGSWVPSTSMSDAHFYRSAQLLYFDPHCPQKPNYALHSIPNPHYHTNQIRALPLKNVDPSMLLGFVFLSQHDATEFVQRVQTWSSGALFYISEHDDIILLIGSDDEAQYPPQKNGIEKDPEKKEVEVDRLGWSQVDALHDVHSA